MDGVRSVHKTLIPSIRLAIRENPGRYSFSHFLSLTDEPLAPGSQKLVLAMHVPTKGTAYLVIPFLVQITCQP